MLKQNTDLLLIQEHWLKKDQNIPFGNTIAKTSEEADIIITGGRRAKGGLAIIANDRTAPLCKVLAETKHYIHIKVNELNILNLYIAPSAPDSILLDVFDYASEINGPCILLGDINARFGEFSRDSATNKRGAQFLEYLPNYFFELLEPDKGRWTSINHMGRGIPDHAFSRDAEILEYEILDNSISDHLPLSLKVNTSQEIHHKYYQRWHIRKLAEETTREKYSEYVKENLSIHKEQFPGWSVEDQWQCLKKTLEEAALDSCGIYSKQAPKLQPLASSKLQELAAEIGALTNNMVNLVNHHKAQWNTLNSKRSSLCREYTVLYNNTLRKSFQSLMGDLSVKQNREALLKRVTCKTKAASRSAKSLDPDQMQTHEDHFKTTFGRKTVIKLSATETRNNLSLDIDDIKWALGRMKAGKAAGDDGLFAEMWKLAECVPEYLLILFNNILETLQMPETWKNALVCPIYKQKGDSRDAANYRPIAITSTCRRIFEKCIDLVLLRPFVEKLSDSQCGFRAERNTLQQVFVLHEAMIKGPNHVALMDMKAAYDSVNRDILWLKMAQKFDIPEATISILKMLFDSNTSTLLIKNQKSTPIANTSGLLQGSSLSPILFNFFIDDLLKKLSQQTGIRTYGIDISNLAFADDIAILAKTIDELQVLIGTCEEWASENEMEFNPTKCVYIGEATAPLLYGIAICKEERAKYLGIMFTTNGIETRLTAQERTKKAYNTITNLGKHGMNLTGLSIEASIMVYKTYIRPILEYGILFMDPDGLLILQRCQETALRTIFSANRNTSRAAMHLLARVEPLLERQLLLKVSFFGRLNNWNNAAVPAVKVWWNGLLETRPKNSLMNKAFQKNSLFHMVPKRNHLLTQLTRNNPSIEPWPRIEPEIRVAASIKARDTLVIKDHNIAEALGETDTSKYRTILEASEVDLTHKTDVIRWLLGNVCWHSRCMKCDNGTEVSRYHGLYCSGALIEIQVILEAELNVYQNFQEKDRWTFLDKMLFEARYSDFPAVYHLASRWISMIQTNCLGLKRNLNGRFFDPERHPDMTADDLTTVQYIERMSIDEIHDWRKRISLDENCAQSKYIGYYNAEVKDIVEEIYFMENVMEAESEELRIASDLNTNTKRTKQTGATVVSDKRTKQTGANTEVICEMKTDCVESKMKSRMNADPEAAEVLGENPKSKRATQTGANVESDKRAKQTGANKRNKLTVAENIHETEVVDSMSVDQEIVELKMNVDPDKEIDYLLLPGVVNPIHQNKNKRPTSSSRRKSQSLKRARSITEYQSQMQQKRRQSKSPEPESTRISEDSLTNPGSGPTEFLESNYQDQSQAAAKQETKVSRTAVFDIETAVDAENQKSEKSKVKQAKDPADPGPSSRKPRKRQKLSTEELAKNKKNAEKWFSKKK
jgi:hypothetical protein